MPATIRWPGPAADLTPDSRAVAMLRSGAAKYRWIAATVGGFTATRFQVAAGSPVMAVGGPLGTDPLPSLDQFRRYVGAGDIHYFIAPEMGPGNPNEIGPRSRVIVEWVEHSYQPIVTGKVVLYDVTHP
jgi:hypothetical protein